MSTELYFQASLGLPTLFNGSCHIMQDGVNALHIAAFAGYKETVELLIQHKVNVDAADNVRSL